MNQDTSELMQIARANVAGFHRDTGVLCTVRRLTYDPVKKLYSPPYVNTAENIPFSVASLASLRDPQFSSAALRLNIGFDRYRLLTCPYGVVDIGRDYYVIQEPVSSASNRYLVVEAMAPDESSPLELVLHCQKV